jgi:hypothetical protein
VARSPARSASAAAPYPCRRNCSAVPYRICRAGLTPAADTSIRNATAGSALAASIAAQPPWL